MVLLKPIPYLISKRILKSKIHYSLPDDSFYYIYKVDVSNKILCFVEHRQINGLVIIIWKNELDMNPYEKMIILKLYNKINPNCLTPIYLTSNEISMNIQFTQLDKDNFQIRGILSRNCYIFNLNVFTCTEYEILCGKMYRLIKNPDTTELLYYITNNDN